MASGERFKALLNHEITRRQAIGTGLVAVVGIYAGLYVHDDVVPRYFPSAPEAEDIKSNTVNLGVIAIRKGVNIRTSRRIPNRTRFSKPDNTIEWDEIGKVNGVSLGEKSEFIIVNPMIIDRERTSDRYRPGWFRLDIQRKGSEDVQPFYVSNSQSTRDFVKFLGFAGYVGDSETEDFGYIIGPDGFDGDLGRVIVPENPETMARDIMPTLWSERMRKKFRGTFDLDSGDTIVPSLEVVAGDEEMVELNTPVNVRDYPSLEYGNGEPTTIVGRVAQGTAIQYAILFPDDYYHQDFAAVRSEDIKGPLLDADGDQFMLEAGKIVAISSVYLRQV